MEIKVINIPKRKDACLSCHFCLNVKVKSGYWCCLFSCYLEETDFKAYKTKQCKATQVKIEIVKD